MHSLNVLIGANGSKSNFISLFRLLNEMYEQQLQIYIQKQGGPDALLHFGRSTTERLHAVFYFANNGYKFDLVPTSDNRLIFEREVSWFGGVFFNTTPSAILGTTHAESKLKEAKDKYSPYVRPAISSWRVYHFHAPAKRPRLSDNTRPMTTSDWKVDAANLAAYFADAE